MVGIPWIGVKERTTEIGIRRALGATATDIFSQVLFESTALAVLGCGLGSAISLPLSWIITNSPGLPFVFDFGSASLAFAAAGLLNVFFALWPSRKAACVSPLAALRYE